MKEIIAFLIYIIDSIIPKKSGQVAFSSFPDLSDNSYAMFQYLYKNKKCKKYIWLLGSLEKSAQYRQMIVEDLDLFSSELKDITLVKKNSVKGLWLYLRSKYIFFTHGLYPRVKFSKKHTVVNLWHGMPLKTIGLLDDPNNKNIPPSAFAIATSSFFQSYMAKAFGLASDDILVSGQPRNDLLFEKSNCLEKLNIQKGRYRKIFLWTPTYRKSMIGALHNDGKMTNELPVIGDGITDLNDMLLNLNSYMIIKLHPMDALNNKNFKNFSNIVFLNNTNLEDKNCQLYALLEQTDVLLTDFSSIYIDFLLLDRPMGFVADDFEIYEGSRGFVMENPKAYMPGPFIESKDGLLRFLEKCVNGIDEYRKDRHRVNQILNIQDKSFSENLWEEIKKREGSI
jgi:CDP-glycerol glycerophosphotransferase (TagB/SpsB family)